MQELAVLYDTMLSLLTFPINTVQAPQSPSAQPSFDPLKFCSILK